MCSVFLVPKKGGGDGEVGGGSGKQRFHNPLLKQGFAPLFPCCDYYLDYCHDYYLKVFTRDKDWLFTLFLLFLSFWRENRRLTVKLLNWSSPISCLRKC